MSGIFGIIPSDPDLPTRQTFKKMARAMCHRPWFVADTYFDEVAGIGLGRISIGIFNKENQPIVSEDNDTVVFMSGELYNASAIRLELEKKGYSFKNNSDLELVLHLYKEKGIDFPAGLNGAFFIAIWDRGKSQLIIANDRFGLYPHYYIYNRGYLLFSPEVKGLLCDSTFKPKLDFTSLSQYMRFQHLLGDRTFFKNIRVLPGASVSIFNIKNGEFTIKKYWDFDQIEYRPRIRLSEAVEEAGRLLRLSVHRRSSDHYRPGVFLSGGLDSRTILGLIDSRPIVSINYGQRDCRDVYYARRIADRVGSDHHWIELQGGSWVQQNLDFHMNITEGFHSWIHSHGINALPLARNLFDVNLTGWDGGTVMGTEDAIDPLQTEAVDDTALVAHLFHLYNQKYTWPSITEEEEHFLYSETTRKNLQGRAFESFAEELSPYLDFRPDIRSEVFFISNHCLRLTQSMITFMRSHVEVRIPFFDYELFDFLYSLPASVRGNRVLYIHIIQQQIQKMTTIPYDHDEFLPTTKSFIRNIHALSIKLRRRFDKHIFPLFPERFTLYADYENYLRKDLKNWAESILFDERTLSRGIFNPDFISSIWKRHQSRQEMHTIGKIAPIITYEMMLRRFYD